MAFTNIKIHENRVRIQHGFRILLYRCSEKRKRWKKFTIKSEIPVQSWVSLELHSDIHQILTHSHPEIRQLAKRINQRGFEYFDAWWDLLFEMPRFRFREGPTGWRVLKGLLHPVGCGGPTGLTGPIGIQGPTGRFNSKTPNLAYFPKQWIKVT